MFKEEFLHYIWQYKLFNTNSLLTTQGEVVEVIHTGYPNSDSGPDFFNAKIKIGKTVWAGNVEIHIKSSDWIKHNHQEDQAYQNTILYVVYQNDKEIKYSTGKEIPAIQLQPLIDNTLIEKYQDLLSSKDWIPCGEQIKQVDSFIVQNWLNRLVLERLERKSEEIEATLKLNKNDWEKTLYHYLFKYVGLKVNAEPFHLLAKNTSLKIIDKHRNITSIEALLFGQAGFLQEEIEDEYYQQLKKEYQFLKAKFILQPMDKSLWKFLRLRPNNFPPIRIAQLTNLLVNNSRIFSKIIEADSSKQIQSFFNATASSYWNNHYQFDKKSNKNFPKKIGDLMMNNIIINVVVPLIFVYAKSKQDERKKEKALQLLEEIKAEKNTIISNWEKLGVKIENSLQTQALLELKSNYCSQKKCLNCSIGNKILKPKPNEKQHPIKTRETGVWGL